ncbi:MULTISPECIES: hypothetical protein [unclassified Spirillospora]|uniref:hypothetical protein n=1 Tax=unclassified Spirillospora TaxID=2642701 RepID=UPI00371A0C7C
MDRPSAIDRRTLARHIAGDVDRVAPLLARLLVIRAIWNIRHRRGDHSLWVAQDMAADCREELRAAGTTTRNLARALVPDHDVDHDLTTAITGADRLSTAIRSERDAYADYHLATDPDSLDKQRAAEMGRRWQEKQDHAGEALRGLPGDLGRGEAGSLLLDRALDRVFERGPYYQARHYLFSREPERAWRRRVAGVLHDEASTAMVRGSRAATGDLAADLRHGCRALGDTAPSAWAGQAAGRLEHIAIPVFTGTKPLTPDKVTAIRLLALCLTCELETDRPSAAGDPFRVVVAGITSMERDTV